jgi:hypothetical protein
MTEDVETFHFIDLLSLHLRAQLDCPETRGLLPLMWHLSGFVVPGLIFYPPPIVEALRAELHRQHPWLRVVRMPDLFHLRDKGVDWAFFWAWADSLQGKTCERLSVAPHGFPLTTITRDRLPALPLLIVIEPPENPDQDA